MGRGAVYVAGKPHTVGTQGSIHRHTRADTVVTQGPGDTVGTQEGTRWEGCPDGRHGALHRVHEALPRERETDLQKPTIEARPPLACKAAFAGDGGLSLPEGRKKIAFATKKFPNCNRVRTSTNPRICRRFGRGTPKQQRRFGRGTPKQQQRRPTRVRFCRLGPLDRTRLRCRTTVPQLVRDWAAGMWASASQVTATGAGF